MKKFRFGVSARGRGDTLEGLKDFARKAEDLGYDVLMLPDHLNEQLSAMYPLVAAAQHTTRLRFTTLTLANDFRHPVMTAKEAATVDVLTGGRFELGIGTGSADNDNRMAGLPVDPPGVRVERITETVRIVKAFLAGEKVTFAGKHYQVDGLPGYPRPVQAHLPLLLGASGPRMLRLAAREADIIGIMGGRGGSMAEKRDVIREAAGARWDQIELNTLGMRVQVDGQPNLPASMPPMAGYVGSRDEVVEQLLKQREESDVSYISIVGGALEAFAPVVAKLAGA
jgi:probable F420-dependent oxidoreductase